MKIRRVILAQNGCFEDVARLPSHPNVRKYWSLPRDYALIEFYHPACQRIYDSDPSVSSAAWADISVRNAMVEAGAVERELLGPLSRQVPDLSDAVLLGIPSPSVIYDFMGSGKGQMRWPEIGLSPSWETARTIRVVARLAVVVPELMSAFESVVLTWQDCMKQFGEIKTCGPLSGSDGEISCVFSFREGCGDAAMALHMLAADTRHLTSLNAIGFFAPGDVSSPFLEIGGPGKSYQRTCRAVE